MKINGRTFTVGADPEVFITKGGLVHSAYGLIQGTKQAPFKVVKGAVQVDGMALEFNIDPAESSQEFLENLAVVQEQLKEMIGDWEFSDKASYVFDEGYILEQPFEAIQLGCEPDYNAYTGWENEAPNQESCMRTVGGHTHVGGYFTKDCYQPEHMKDMARLARIMDETIGVYSILWDKDDDRRSLYGKAGAFRPKEYGMEYRTLSNVWAFKPKIAEFVFGGVKEAITKHLNGYDPKDSVRGIIDNSDRKSAFFNNNPTADFVKKNLLGV